MAIEYFVRGVALEDAPCVGWLGACYRDGEGVPQNSVRAAELFRQAAELGHVDSMEKLGRCYKDGDGVAKDLAEAVHWWQVAGLLDLTDDSYIAKQATYWRRRLPAATAEAVARRVSKTFARISVPPLQVPETALAAMSGADVAAVAMNTVSTSKANATEADETTASAPTKKRKGTK